MTFLSKNYKGHVHTWQKTERRQHGAVFKLFVCTDHPEPLVKAYDMEVANRGAFIGSTEYRSNQRKEG